VVNIDEQFGSSQQSSTGQFSSAKKLLIRCVEPSNNPPVSFSFDWPPNITLNQESLQVRKEETIDEEGELQTQLVAETESVEYHSRPDVWGNYGKVYFGVARGSDKMLKLDLVEMEGIYCLSGQLKKLKDRYAVTYHQDELEDDTAKKLLVNEFGSRLRQTMQNNYERNILDETTVGEDNSEQLDELLGEAKKAKEEIQCSIREDLPPYDSETSNIAEVYKINAFLSPAIKNNLRKLHSILLKSLKSQNPPPTDSKIFPCIAQLLPVVKKSGKVGRSTKLYLLAYANTMIQFLQSSPKLKKPNQKLSQLSKAIDIAPGVLQILLQNFTEMRTRDAGTSYYMTDFLKGKLINYLLVFLLTACDFSLPLNELQRDLTEPKDRLRDRLRMVGCEVQHRGSEVGYVAKLKAPLSFPEVRKRKR